MKMSSKSGILLLMVALLNVGAAEPATAPTSTGNLLQDAEFATLGKAGSPWKLILVKDTTSTLEATTVEGKAAALVTVKEGHGANLGWQVQFSQAKLELKKGVKYKLVFTAKAEGEHPINYFVQQTGKPYAMLGVNVSEKLGAEAKTITKEFTCTADESNAKLGIALGSVAGKVTITSISLTKVE